MVASAQSALSSTEQWKRQISQQGDDRQNLEKLLVHRLPYSLLRKLGDVMAKTWKDWNPHAEKFISPPINAKHFIAYISSEDCALPLSELFKVAKQINDVTIEQCLFAFEIPSQKRALEDRDRSRGLMNTLDEVTLVQLANRIEESRIDWRLLADGLGFDNLQCLAFPSPKKMVKAWMLKNPFATVSRLFFEASELKMKDVCSFLDAIPLQGVRKVAIIPIRDKNLLNPVTVFQMKRLDELFLEQGELFNWNDAAKLVYPDLSTKNPTKSGMEIFEISGETSLDLLDWLKNNEKLKPAVQAFERELALGEFKNQSSGGISFEEIKSLAEVTAENYTIKTHLPYPQRLPLDMEILKNHILPGATLETPFNFFDFLLVCWQSPNVGERLDLTNFCLKIGEMLKTVRNGSGKQACNPGFHGKALIQVFEEVHLKIKSLRSYKKELERV